MLLTIVMFGFGIAALSKGEFKITGNRKVKGNVGKFLGGLLILGSAGAFIQDYGFVMQSLTLAIVIIIGLATSEKIGQESKIIDIK
jgi:hypothetical protein